MIRLYETGISSKDIRFVIGITGLSPKSSKVLMDGRFTGHERHQGSDYRLPLAPKFDRSDRYVSRCNEIIEPCRIIHGTFHRRLTLLGRFAGIILLVLILIDEKRV